MDFGHTIIIVHGYLYRIRVLFLFSNALENWIITR